MARYSRREFGAVAAALGAALAFAGKARASRTGWTEDRSRFPEGVASGDPTHEGVMLWTRWEPRAQDGDAHLVVELAEDADFSRVLFSKRVGVSSDADWTCRVLVHGLRPSSEYFYRFTGPSGAGSRIGRTLTAPSPNDGRPTRFAFVSCQNINLGALTAYRRMMYDDRCAESNARLGFVLHLGDFIYGTVWQPKDRPNGYFDRTVRAVDFPGAEQIDDIQVPTTLDGYRAIYRAYLRNPDLQDARARWPFVAIWDNGEFSDTGWQGLERYRGVTRPAQTRKVAAFQAWFEYMPARVETSGGSLQRFSGPAVENAPVSRFDEHGLGQERNNLLAIASLRGYRTHRWGRHVDIFLTDQRSYRSEDFTAPPAAKAMASSRFPQMVPMETLQMIDAGAGWASGNPPDELQFGDHKGVNFRKGDRPRTLLGAKQKAWLLDRLARSTATWKVWGNTVATLDMRADPQHLPETFADKWPGRNYAGYARLDHSTAYAERGEIYDFVRDRKIGGFVTLCGDRHSFWAGYSAKALPPEEFRPVGVAFVVASITSPGMVEAFEHTLAPAHPLRPLYLIDRGKDLPPEPSVNLLLRHGVRTCLDYAAHGDLIRAKALADPGNAPHVEFVDMGGHGYGVVSASERRFEVEFVCIPRPITEVGSPDGGPLRYRVHHGVDIWAGGTAPRLSRTLLEGDAGLSA